MQEVITKTIIILAAMVAVILIFNRFGRKKNAGCGCGCGNSHNGAEAACGDCPQASGCEKPERQTNKEKQSGA